eukprot:TRINITY_DN934_c0_g1_i3.p1 TRINITY_DN934_c0_g1~~TRINITY_DN934_c0_g1_i3.p1  ORF type:complete len:851 (+),score=284.32 TRINITY_DN934_c0_g1_i3:195-2747(+)
MSLPETSDNGLVPASLTQLLQQADLLSARLKLNEALALYEQALALRPHSIEALNGKGSCLKRLERPHEALAAFAAVLAVEPGNVAALVSCGLIYLECDKFVDAVAVLERALQLEPHNATVRSHLAQVLTDVGTQLKLMGHVAQARQKYEAALLLLPSYALAHHNLAIVDAEAGDSEQAMRHYELAVEHNAFYVEAWCNLGVLHKNRGHLLQAIAMYERALSINANYGLARANLAIALNDLGTHLKQTVVPAKLGLKQAVSHYRRALVYNPFYADAHYNLGVAYAERHSFGKALVHYELAVHFNPSCCKAYNNLGVIHRDHDNLDKAVQCYQAALAINPRFAQTLNNLAVVYTIKGLVDEARTSLRAALAENPHYAEAYNNLGVLDRDQGRVAESLHCYETALRLNPLDRNAGQNRLLALNFVDDMHQRQVAYVTEQHRQWAAAFEKLHQPLPPVQPPPSPAAAAAHACAAAAPSPLSPRCALPPAASVGLEPPPRLSQLESAAASAASAASVDTSHSASPSTVSDASADSGDLRPDRVLRVGYMSSDFFTHSVSYFVHAPIQFHRPDNCYVICYSHVLKPDAKTHLLRSLANEWRDVHGLSAAEIARQIRADRIDVLVELAGHTAGNLLDVVAMRPAPIQVAYCGYPNTTGLESVQYRLTDAWADPPDTKQEFVEQLVRLPRCFLCYTPSAEAGPESVAPCLGSGGVVTIGSFNNLSKINARVLRCWLTVLQRVPNSRLMLKCKPFASASVQQQFLDMFSARGIDPSRIDLLPLLPLNNQHMQSYSLVDLTLDTFPYAGTTTTCEALWMGVPVVTLRGPCHAQNVGVSLLTAIGQQALIADTGLWSVLSS